MNHCFGFYNYDGYNNNNNNNNKSLNLYDVNT